MSRWDDFIAWLSAELRKPSRNSEISSDCVLSSKPGSSRIDRTSRRKACQKCVQAKTACDLGKPKCKRCRDRGISCGYPAHAKSKSGATADNQYASVDVSPFSTVSDVISLDSTGPEGLVKSTGNVCHTPSYPTITDSGPVHIDATAALNFQEIDLVPMVDAEEIRSGWLRPYLSSSTGQEPKQLSAHTIQYLTCVLKSYLRDLLNSSAPPFVHLMQQVRTYPPLFTYCFTLVRAWLVLVAFSELNSRKRKYRTRIQDTTTQLC